MGQYKPDLVLYHANCSDGFGAAYAAWRRWGDDVKYLAVDYNRPPPDVTGLHVLIGDFSFKKDVLKLLEKDAKSIIILDHHKSAWKDLCEWVGTERTVDRFKASALTNNQSDTVVLFDMNKSGARMMWEFCHSDPVPPLIQHVEDYDLWKFDLEMTKAFSLYLRSEPFSFSRWSQIEADMKRMRGMEIIRSEANAILRYHRTKVDELVATAHFTNIQNHHVPIVNCPKAFTSDVCNQLLDVYPDSPFSAAYEESKECRKYSLRSRDDRTDVSEIAERFGGGGHHNAAGFKVDRPIFV